MGEGKEQASGRSHTRTEERKEMGRQEGSGKGSGSEHRPPPGWCLRHIGQKHSQELLLPGSSPAPFICSTSGGAFLSVI